MSPPSSNEAFLAACIKYAKEKVSVDFEALAKELEMSKGGAANKYRAIMKQLEDEGAAWTKDAKDEVKATSTTGVKRKTIAKKDSQADKTATNTVKTVGGSASDEAEDGPPKKKLRGKATKTNAAKLAEDVEKDDDVGVTTTVEKKHKGKGTKKVDPETPDGGSLGDDEATPGNNVGEGARKAVKKTVPTAKMVDAAMKIVKTEVVPRRGEN